MPFRCVAITTRVDKTEPLPRVFSGISHAPGVFHAQSAFHKSERIYFDEKTTFAISKCGFFLAEDEGFEPPQTESESGVLPLHKSSICAPLALAHKQHGYYSTVYENVKQYFSLFQKIFHPGNPWPGRGKYVPKMRENEKSSCKMEMGMVLLICNILERPGPGSFGSF